MGASTLPCWDGDYVTFVKLPLDGRYLGNCKEPAVHKLRMFPIPPLFKPLLSLIWNFSPCPFSFSIFFLVWVAFLIVWFSVSLWMKCTMFKVVFCFVLFWLQISCKFNILGPQCVGSWTIRLGESLGLFPVVSMPEGDWETQGPRECLWLLGLDCIFLLCLSPSDSVTSELPGPYCLCLRVCGCCSSRKTIMQVSPVLLSWTAKKPMEWHVFS